MAESSRRPAIASFLRILGWICIVGGVLGSPAIFAMGGTLAMVMLDLAAGGALLGMAKIIDQLDDLLHRP